MLATNGFVGVFLNSQHNFAWLTGGASNGIDSSRDNGAAWLFVTSTGKRYLLSNNIETNRMLSEELSGTDFESVVLPWQIEKGSPSAIYEQAASLVPAGSTL